MAVAVARKLSSSTTSLLPKLAWNSLACLAETGRGSSRCLSLDAAKAPGWILDIGRSNRHAAERKAVEAAESQILCRLYEAGTYTGGINQPTLSVARFVIGDEKKSTSNICSCTTTGMLDFPVPLAPIMQLSCGPGSKISASD